MNIQQCGFCVKVHYNIIFMSVLITVMWLGFVPHCSFFSVMQNNWYSVHIGCFKINRKYVHLRRDLHWDLQCLICPQVIQWCTHHKDDPPPPEDDENKEKRTDDIPVWDQEFLKVDQGTLFELILVCKTACALTASVRWNGAVWYRVADLI